MDATTFLNIISKYGEENIIGIGFDNSASITFDTAEKFSLANNYVDDIQCLQFIEFDRNLKPYHVLKSVADIQAIMVRDSGVDRNSYDMISIRP